MMLYDVIWVYQPTTMTLGGSTLYYSPVSGLWVSDAAGCRTHEHGLPLVLMVTIVQATVLGYITNLV